MWAQSWNNLGDLVKPYPNKPSVDVTDAMVRKGWTAKKMFEKADEFFQSMGLPEMPRVRQEKQRYNLFLGPVCAWLGILSF